jgi:hypothetical protein
MKRYLSTLIRVSIAVLATIVCTGASLPTSATLTPPMVAVYLKNFVTRYDTATQDFFTAQFATPSSLANGLISYKYVSDLSQTSLNGTAAVIIDESSDMTLSSTETADLHNYVGKGGKVGLFVDPIHYRTNPQYGPNPAAYQGVADLFGQVAVAIPSVFNGTNSATVPAIGTYNKPFDVHGATITTYDDQPFYSLTSTGMRTWLVNSDHQPAAIAGVNGFLIGQSIGDEVEDGDANLAFNQYFVDMIVWLARGASLPNLLFMPIIIR